MFIILQDKNELFVGRTEDFENITYSSNVGADTPSSNRRND